MPDQIDEKWRSGRNTPTYNKTADSRSHSERLNDINSRADRLPAEERDLYTHMVKTQERDFNQLLAKQENEHPKELERLTSDFLKDKEGFNLQDTSPSVRRGLAEKKAVRVMAESENGEQDRSLRSFLTQREGFVNYCEVEVAKKQATQDKRNESSNSEGRKR